MIFIRQNGVVYGSCVRIPSVNDFPIASRPQHSEIGHMLHEEAILDQGALFCPTSA